MAFSRAPRGSGPVTKIHIVVISLLLVGLFVITPLLIWLTGWLDDRRTLVEVSSSPRLARAEAALRDLDTCSIEYDRKGLERGRGMRYLDVLFVEPCGAAGLTRYRAPKGWETVGHTSPAFRLERDSKGEVWRVHGVATPDALAKALEEASPVLHGRSMQQGEY